MAAYPGKNPSVHRSQARAVLCSVYVPRTSRQPKPNSRRSQDCVVLCSRLRPKHVTSAQAEQSPVPRPCRALFPATSREHHVGPSRTVAGPKTVSCSVSVYVPRTSRRPKPNNRRSQDRVVLCFRLRPENITSAQAEQSPVPRPCRALFPSNDPRTSRRPKPNLNRSKGPSVLCARLHPASVASAQPNRRRPRNNVTPAPSRASPDPHRAVLCAWYVTRTSRRPNPKRRRSQDRTVLRFLLRPKTVTSG